MTETLQFLDRRGIILTVSPPQRRDTRDNMEALHGLGQLDQVAEVSLTAENSLLRVNGHTLGDEVGLWQARRVADTAAGMRDIRCRWSGSRRQCRNTSR